MAETNARRTKSEIFESIGSILWLLMDCLWHKGLVTASLLLIPPTILLHLLALAFIERRFVYITLTSAVNFWVIANAFWIVADLKEIPALDRPADVFFYLAITFTILTAAKMTQEGDFSPFFQKFRRLRIWVK